MARTALTFDSIDTPPVRLRVVDMITELDATTAAEGVTRAQWIRQAVAARLAAAHRRD